MEYSVSSQRTLFFFALISLFIVAVGGYLLPGSAAADTIPVAETELTEGAVDAGAVGPSPDGIWTIVDGVVFPPDFSPPTEYVAAKLNYDALQAVLATAPPEGSRENPEGVRLTVPLPDGEFGFFSVFSTLMMERALADTFLEIATYHFVSAEAPTLTGHLLTGRMKLYATGRSVDGLLRIEPVQTTDQGMIYLSFFDRNRTDERNEFEHVLDEQVDESPPPVPAAGGSTLDVIQNLAFGQAMFAPLAETGDTLRTFRFTATTTGEFYQANDNGGGDIDVILSLLQRILAVDAVMEPEISVRLILAANTLDVLFDDPNTDGINDGDTPCNLREANRTIAQANLAEGDYDVGFLFSTGSSGGCAWYVVCEDSANGFPDHDKARGAGHFGANGLGLGTGLILHETGHQLGAKHTYSGQASGCNLANFDGDDGDGLPSAFAPGSGSTIMSYSGSCGMDNVNLGLIGTGQYYHAKSFEQIVDNITSGNGSLCGGSFNTGNNAPTVTAGPDYTIPRQTPFTLTGTGIDDEPLMFTWEQIDLATTQRPIDTDNNMVSPGPIIRSVPPVSSPSRTIPDIRDLLANVSNPILGMNRPGELLPLTDRTLTFRLTARDNLPGGGGVSSDDMVVTTSGAPFYITSPNDGSLQAGCAVPVTWQIGGGDIAANVDISYSITGGLQGSQESFPDVIVSGTPNDGEYPMTVPCGNTSQGRIKVMASDSIFFDVNDNNLNVINDPPEVNIDPVADGEVDEACEFTVEFSATVTDSCGISAADVDVTLSKEPPGEYTLGVPTVNVMQNGDTQVDVSGSVLVSELMSSPVVVRVQVDGTDNCGESDSDTVMVEVADTTPPEIDVTVSPDSLWPPNHKMRAIQANVIATDNCPGVSYVLSEITSDEPDNGVGDGDTDNDIQNADVGTPDLEFDLRAERAAGEDGRTYTVTYTATDIGNNSDDDSATVTVAHDKGK
ncbi:MAG: reprolysin-like metallopeptidase [Gammaproteobacteria bacterium]